MTYNNYNSNIHHRRSIRLKGYDYSSEGLYFITLCVNDKKSLFGEIKNGEMILNQYGEIAREEWIRTTELRKNITLGDFIFMPNHMHCIISIDYQIRKTNNTIGDFKSPSNTIGAIIRGYKGASTKIINFLLREKIKKKNSTGESQFAPTLKSPSQGSIWQRNYYDIIIKTDQAYQNISSYIINNPKNWNKDKFNNKL